ncbi:MAG: TonB-dependent receptor [Pseudomonadota bacterium]
MKSQTSARYWVKTASITAIAGAMLTPTHAFSQIDEVITTAQRRAETAQDVPVALTVLSAEDLEINQIQDTLDLQAFVPNLNLGTNTGTANAARIFLRGIGEDESRGLVEPAVGTYVDGVYVGRIVGALFDLVDLEQIEVLRGPQGTLYGRNSNGGALKITTMRPDTESYGANGRFTYGNNDRLDLKGTVNIPLSDRTAVRLSGLYKSRDGFFDINPNGTLAGQSVENVGDLDTLAFRGSLSHDFGDNWNVLLIADYTDDNSDPIPSSIVDTLDADGDLFTIEPAPGTSCVDGGPADREAGSFQFTRPVGCFTGFFNETKSQGISGTITGDLGDLTVESITAFRRMDDDLSSHIGFPYRQETDQEQLSQEVTLSSNFDGPFNYVAGIYYFKEDLNLDTSFVFPFRVAADVESFAIFGQGEYDFGDFTFTGGLRYTDENRDFEGIAFTSGLTNQVDVGGDNISYTAKLDYNVNEDVLVYASYSTGFKGAAVSPDCFGPTACFLPVEEEEVGTLEFGFKSSWAEDRLRLNGTYFYNQYDNLQIAATVPGLGFTRFNVEETEISGLEFDLTYAPTERFELSANLGILDGQYEELTQAQASALTNAGVPCPGGVATIECALDLELKNAPSYKANIAATYFQPFMDGELIFSGDVSFEDDSFNLVANSPASALSEIPTLANARIAYRPDDAAWNVAIWARNILDKEYFRAGTANANAVYAAEPLTYGVDIGFNF